MRRLYTYMYITELVYRRKINDNSFLFFLIAGMHSAHPNERVRSAVCTMVRWYETASMWSHFAD